MSERNPSTFDLPPFGPDDFWTIDGYVVGACLFGLVLAGRAAWVLADMAGWL